MESAERIPVVSQPEDVVVLPSFRPEDVAVGCVWTIGDTGKKVYIKTPTSIDVSGGGERMTEQFFGTPEELQSFLQREGYTFSHIRGQKADTDGNVVHFDFKPVRNPDDSKQETGVDEVFPITIIHEEIKVLCNQGQALVNQMDDIAQQIAGLPHKGHAGQIGRMQKKLDAITVPFNEKIASIEALVDTDEEEIVLLDDQKISMDDALVAKGRRRDEIEGLIEELEGLLVQARKEVDSFVSRLAASTETNVAASSTKDMTPAVGASEKVASEKKKRAPRRKGNGGGPGDGGDGAGEDGGNKEPTEPTAPKPKGEGKKKLRDIVPEPSVMPKGAAEKPKESEDAKKFEAMLGGLRTEVLGLIDTIKTPEEYVAFRRRMWILPPKEEGAPPRYNFFKLNDIKDQVQRVISEEEREQVYALEKELREVMWQKFFGLVRADLRKQYNREQARVDSLKNEGDLSWKPNVDFIWKDVFDTLTEREQQKVSGEYQECLDRLNENFRQKRNSLKSALVENPSVKKNPREEGKELSNEEQFALLVDVLRKRRNPSIGKDSKGNELVIESITDAEIQYSDGGKIRKTVTPTYVKGFLKFLKEKFSWRLEERLNGFHPNKMAPKMERSGGKTFEALAEMLSTRKKKQCVSVVSEGLAPLGQYAEQLGLSLRSIVESMGIEKVAEGLVTFLDGILPSEWSAEERSQFALQFAQREIRESLE